MAQRARRARWTARRSPARPSSPVSARTGAGLDDLRDAPGGTWSGRSRTPDPRRGRPALGGPVLHDQGRRDGRDRHAAGRHGRGRRPAGDAGTATPSGSAGSSRSADRSSAASGVARVALNLTGENRAELDRHSVLVSPGAWRLRRGPRRAAARTAGRPDDATAAVGRCCTSARPRCRRTCRPLGGDLARLTLDRPLPLRVGDRSAAAGPRQPADLGARRSSTRRRRHWVAGAPRRERAARPGIGRGPSRPGRRAGSPRGGAPRPAAADRRPGRDLRREPGRLAGRGTRGRAAAGRCSRTWCGRHDAAEPLDPGLPVAAVAERLGLPSPLLVERLVRPPLRVVRGRVTATTDGSTANGLPPRWRWPSRRWRPRPRCGGVRRAHRGPAAASCGWIHAR